MAHKVRGYVPHDSADNAKNMNVSDNEAVVRSMELSYGSSRLRIGRSQFDELLRKQRHTQGRMLLGKR